MWSRLKFFYFNKTNILDRYLIREFTGPFLLATGGFAIIAIEDKKFSNDRLFFVDFVDVEKTIARIFKNNVF